MGLTAALEDAHGSWNKNWDAGSCGHDAVPGVGGISKIRVKTQTTGLAEPKHRRLWPRVPREAMGTPPPCTSLCTVRF